MRQTRPVQQADLRLLRVFQTIVQSGGISAAEIALDVGRSTISRQLSDLELRLGMKLCDRGPGGFALTEEGNQVYEAATRLLASVDNFAVEINEVNNRLIGRLSIALFDMTLTNPNSKVSDAFRRFDEAAPDVTLSLRVLGTDDAEKGLLNSEIHVAVVPAQRRSSSLDYHPLYSEDMYLYCGAGHPLFDKLDETISTSKVRASHYVGLDFHSPNMAASQKERLTRHAQANDQEALALLIQSGRYVGFLPDHFAEQYVELGQLRRIRPDRYHYSPQFSAVVKNHPPMARITRVFLDCLLAAHDSGTTA